MPAWDSGYIIAPATPTYSTSSLYSAIVSATRRYTFTAPAGLTPGVYHDFITASDGGATSSTSWIRIVVAP
jgi:hypothetical protein